ncbi:putative membrane protein [Candidatus Vecturithrix granuli]|uniref:Putative membrane protein n=1 Tax=Vecturithrix granuli TaxID=1499967 RepID=A0A081BV35_VECG1|nr:putative membrane protein [Candidatus Vecturithrix granuli]
MEIGLILFILIGLAAGWLAGQVVKGGGYGVVGDIIVGVIGALIGGFLFQRSGVFAGAGLLGSLIVATIGAIILLFVLRLIKKA